MARPLPKMNAPALRKNRASESRTPAEAATAIHGRARFTAILETMLAAGGRPAAMNRAAISAPETAVTIARTMLMAQSRLSWRLVSLASFQAAMAIIAMTAGAMP